MSEDEKVRGGQPCASEQPTEAQALRSNVNKSQENISPEDGGVAGKARNQDVLPGILGKQLRAAYSELLNAPVPDAIADLIEQLKNKEPAARGAAPKDSGGEEGSR